MHLRYFSSFFVENTVSLRTVRLYLFHYAVICTNRLVSLLLLLSLVSSLRASVYLLHFIHYLHTKIFDNIFTSFSSDRCCSSMLQRTKICRSFSVILRWFLNFRKFHDISSFRIPSISHFHDTILKSNISPSNKKRNKKANLMF